MFKIRGLVLIFSLFFQLGFTQTKEDQIDSLFANWNKENHPGGTIGVIKGDDILFLKPYGAASLEYQTQNNKETLFNIGSISKQFTAMGIVLLYQQGKLSFDDDIHKFLPELPDFKTTITIRYLLHHTSGLRSLHDLLALAGWRGDDYRTNEDLMRFIKNQKDLNFIPGNEFSYCNTGYVLLAEIIERITNEDFKTWMRDHVFMPLQMKATFIEDNYQNIILNKATSYYHSHDDVYETAQGYWAYTGAGNVYSTTEDLLKWAKNFYSPAEGWEQEFKLLLTLDSLNDGTMNNYAFGLFIDEKFEHSRIQHAGVVGGYRSFLSIYPEDELSIVVLTNFSNAPFGEKADDIASIVLDIPDKKSEELREIITKEPKDSLFQNINLNSYEGTFYSPELETLYTIFLKDKVLKWHHPRHGDHEMVLTTDDSFKSSWPIEKIKFSRDKKGKVIGLYVSNNRVKNLWLKKVDVE